MKTQCPNCKNIFALPDEYKDQSVKCPRCKQDFSPEKSQKPPIIVPDNIARKGGNFTGKILKGIPAPFKIGFLGTLGAISAFFFVFYFLVLYPKKPTSSYIENPVSVKQLYSLQIPIYRDGSSLFELCKALGSLEMAATLKSSSLPEITRSLIIARLNSDMELLDNWNMASYLEEVRDALKAAIQAEIDVFVYEGQNPEKCENGAWYSNQDYMQLMNKSIELRSEASTQIYELMSK